LSPAPVTSFFSSKDGSIDKGNKSKPKSLSVVPHTKTSSSSSSFVVFGTQPPTTIAADHRSLLRSWANHSHADYHNFTEEEADGIRSALLEWYANNRRKLPWRGDPPPFDGSTSGINTSGGSNAKKRGRSRGANAAMKKTKTDGSNQKSITSFFSSTTIKTEEKGDSTTNNSTKSEQDQKGRDSVESDPLLDQAIPVTGYGVWVSEIMLQQTRVEAVIPFWIKCEYKMR
jgi:A/G-specific adenine glycosylase